MMTLKTIQKVEKETAELQQRIHTFLDKYAVYNSYSTKDTAAIRRQSMELTRVLAELRKYS